MDSSIPYKGGGGSKEVLIKSSAAPMPTYVMSCFRLPKRGTRKLLVLYRTSGGVEGETKKVYIGFLGIKFAYIKKKVA